MASEGSEHPAVTRFREYIRIKSVQPDPDYDACVMFLRRMVKDSGAKVMVVECTPGKPVLVISFEGNQPQLPSVMLNSHMDVVPVYPKFWDHDPFGAVKDESGNIYGRGTQDMKSVGIQYLEAILRMREEGKTFQRTIHVVYVPDEEIGGNDGMRKFVLTEQFKNLNVGFALDEGYANPTEKFNLFYGERTVWWVEVKATGQPGHGSQFLQNTAGEKLRRVINSFLAFRDEQEKKMNENEDVHLGDVTSVNLTMLKGGVQYNVVPAELSVGFDIRVTPKQDFDEFEKMMQGWCKEAGEGVTIEFKQKMMNKELTCVEDGKCSWWDTFAKACADEKVSLVKTIFPAATDSRYVRELKIPALGFSPMNKTPILLHDHNEFLNEKIFLRGIDIYCTIIQALADKPE